MNKTYVLVGFIVVFLLLTGGIFYVVKNRGTIQKNETTEQNSITTPESDTAIPTAGDNAPPVTAATVVPPTTAVQTKDTPAPAVEEISLTVNTPKNGSTVNSSLITVSGKTAPNAEVFINDVDTVADATGAFSVKIILEEGDNMIVVVANSPDGKFAEQEMTVTYTSDN
jgi:hypothetical protein